MRYGMLFAVVTVLFLGGCSDEGDKAAPQYDKSSIEDAKKRAEELRRKAREGLTEDMSKKKGDKAAGK